MRIAAFFQIPLAALLLSMAAGCSSSDSKTTGTAPAISNLTYDPKTATAGATATINGKFDFTDPDADLLELRIELVPASGPAPAPLKQTIQGGAAASGSTQFALLLNAPSAQKVDFFVSVTDKAGNSSNKLSGSIVVN